MQVKFPAEDKLGEGKAGGFFSKGGCFYEKGRQETEKLFFILQNSAFLITVSHLHVKCNTLNEKFSTYIPTHKKNAQSSTKILKTCLSVSE